MQEELPEYQIFSILRKGEQDPIGPYSQNQIVALLNDGQIQSDDLVYYDDIGEWKPLREVFEVHQTLANHLDEGQDERIVSDVFGALSDLLSDREPIYYIAVQERTGLNFRKPDSVVLSDGALYVVHYRRGSFEVEPYPWERIHSANARIREEDSLGTFVLLLHDAERVEVERLPRKQLARVTEIATEILSGGPEASESAPGEAESGEPESPPET